jgi:carboxypeptidase family protein
MLRSINSCYASLRGWMALGAMLALFSAGVLAQTTISTGSIQGTVTDSSGAVLSGAKVTITNRATGVSATTNTNGAGAFASGALTPAEYEVRIEAQGFKTQSQNVLVQLNTTSTLNAKMSVGESTQVVEVQASEIAVNTEQATVQGILNATQIENMPVNGRNFLDLAQLEPGIQIQDGGILTRRRRVTVQFLLVAVLVEPRELT